jgi:hypothetical protein
MQQILGRRIRSANIDSSEYRYEILSAIQLLEFNPDMCLTKCRKILELTLYKLYSKLLGNPGTRMLDQLVSDLGRQKLLPRKVVSLCFVVRELGNAGSHPIYDDEQLTHREAQIALLSLINILDWALRARLLQDSDAASRPSGFDGSAGPGEPSAPSVSRLGSAGSETPPAEAEA